MGSIRKNGKKWLKSVSITFLNLEDIMMVSDGPGRLGVLGGHPRWILTFLIVIMKLWGIIIIWTLPDVSQNIWYIANFKVKCHKEYPCT